MPRIRFTAILFLSLLSAAVAGEKTASFIVISEFATRGPGTCNTACEFVELYNPTTQDVSLADWKLQYRSASGTSYNTMVTIPAGAVIRARSYYLIANPSWSGPPAADLLWSGSGMADNGNIRIVDQLGGTVDRVGFGTGNDPEGSAAPNHGDAANNNSVERKAFASSTAATLAAGGSEEFSGNGYDTGNNAADFVVQSNGRVPQNAASPPEPRSVDGSGAAYTPLIHARGGETVDVPIIFKQTGGYIVSDIRIVIPASVTWSRSAADVHLVSGLAATVGVIGDTVTLGGAALTADSAVLRIAGQQLPTSTLFLTYLVMTRGSGGSYAPVQAQPRFLVAGPPIPISEARANDASGVPVLLGQFVTVNGIVTVGKEHGSPSFLQDVTGGIAVYDFAFSDSAGIGDEVTITGKVTQFNGLTELTDVIIDGRSGASGELPPVIVTIPDILADGAGGLERYEGTLVQINNVTVNTGAWSVTGSGTNYVLSDGTASLEVRIDKDVDFANAPAPIGSFDIVGVIGQYQKNAPFIGGYQLMPRRAKDIRATGPRIVTLPVESDITPTSLALAWRTGAGSAAFARIGTTDAYELGTVTGTAQGIEQRVSLTGLSPATIYRVQPFSVSAGDTSFAPVMYVVTASQNSSGTTNVYFNHTVDNSVILEVSPGAKGSENLKNRILDRIDGAVFSVDAAFYSLSGANGDEIASALISAKNRGVRVRVILEYDNSSSAAIGRLRQQVPVILDNFDPVNAGSGLMHNKFLVVDARDRTSDTDDWVVSGSWNASDQGLNDDAQNLIEIQDQALAMVYTREFEEMWGSASDTPNSTASRFGARKSDNTPHRIRIKTLGTVRCYFSPSDLTAQQIVKLVGSAVHSVYFSILTFTRDDVASAMLAKHRAGVRVRGIFDNGSDQGSEYDYLRTNGVDVMLKKNVRGLLHHKYLLIDADTPPDRPKALLTGSYNWSNAAEFSNNENTLIIGTDPMFDADGASAIVYAYLAEWYRRYKDAGGTASIVLSIDRLSPSSESFSLSPPWPNPVATADMRLVSIPFSLVSEAGNVQLSLHDALGREIAVLVDQPMSPGQYTANCDVSRLSAGSYRIVLRSGGAMRSSMLLITH